jgi:CTP:molybdopterin cytidylyltransferase MocA
MSIAAIVVATALTAEDSPVALLPTPAGMTLVEWQVAELQNAGIRDIEVVLGPQADAVIPFVSRDNVEPVIDPAGGAASTLRVGASAVPRGTTAALLSFIEQPRPERVLRLLLDAHMDRVAAITRPARGGVADTPLVLNDDALAWLRNITDERGVDALLERWRDAIAEVPIDSEIVSGEVRSASDLAEGFA